MADEPWRAKKVMFPRGGAPTVEGEGQQERQILRRKEVEETHTFSTKCETQASARWGWGTERADDLKLRS